MIIAIRGLSFDGLKTRGRPYGKLSATRQAEASRWRTEGRRPLIIKLSVRSFVRPVPLCGFSVPSTSSIPPSHLLRPPIFVSPPSLPSLFAGFSVPLPPVPPRSFVSLPYLQFLPATSSVSTPSLPSYFCSSFHHLPSVLLLRPPSFLPFQFAVSWHFHIFESLLTSAT